MAVEAGKRTNRRVAANIPVEYVQTGGEKGSTEIVQISAGGCIVRTTGLDPMGKEVFLHLHLGPENAEVHLRANVVHVNPAAGTGLEFIAVSPEARELLRQYVAEKVLESASGPRRAQEGKTN
jgi:c-di-GMP-binding flagellar brake protein YcgR